VTLRHLQALFVGKSKFVKSAQRPVVPRQLFSAAKHPSILCDRESSICLFLDEASKFCKVVKQVLILVAVAGKDVEDKRLGIWNEK